MGWSTFWDFGAVIPLSLHDDWHQQIMVKETVNPNDRTGSLNNWVITNTLLAVIQQARLYDRYCEYIHIYTSFMGRGNNDH